MDFGCYATMLTTTPWSSAPPIEDTHINDHLPCCQLEMKYNDVESSKLESCHQPALIDLIFSTIKMCKEIDFFNSFSCTQKRTHDAPNSLFGVGILPG